MKELTLFKTKIIIKENLIKEVFDYLDKMSDIHIITDENVANLYLKELTISNFHTYIIKPGEESKNIDNYLNIQNQIISNNASRKSIIIGFGGGVVLDLAGFIASTLFRGVELVYIPTTIIGMIDASIGGKNGIDLKSYKNQIGTFYNPKYVFIDPKLLDTLPKKEYLCGLGEVFKTALIGDKLLFDSFKKGILLDESLIYKLVFIKANIVANDYYEENTRKILNFGHTLGHAIESKSNFKYKHGEAIIYGMIFALELGVKMELTNKKDYQEIKDLFYHYGLGLDDIVFKDYFDYIKYDKKKDKDEIDFVFLEEIGKPIIKKIKLL
ncbi:3-dehydroquinate synthase [Acholeplasma sp. OttesenSCG-928-E16]|nr:3-dehydroquinate synthase [Acholeplasma sp. OttesenSCG-928-E16]